MGTLALTQTAITMRVRVRVQRPRCDDVTGTLDLISETRYYFQTGDREISSSWCRGQIIADRGAEQSTGQDISDSQC